MVLGRWLCLWPCLLSVGCVTLAPRGPPPTLEERCNSGRASACEEWAQQLTAEHQEEAADRALGMACALDSTSSCLEQGKRRMERGDLEGAEPPLTKVYRAEVEEGALALADLHEARGDEAGASRLRWEALAIDKSTVEFALGWRIPWQGGMGASLDMNVQPMGLLARRLVLGANLGFGERLSLNGTVGYQHFVSNWAAPYARALVGAELEKRRNRFNLGAEAGVKFFAGPIGHLGIGLGGASDGSVYTVLEAGLDWVLTLALLAQL